MSRRGLPQRCFGFGLMAGAQNADSANWGGCVFCGSPGEDDVQHLPHCRELNIFSRRALSLGIPVIPEERVDDFLLLAGDDTRGRTLKAVRLAAAYQVHCRYRRAPNSLRGQEVAYRALVQTAKDLVIGHPLATKTYDRRWIRDDGPAGVPRRRPRPDQAGADDAVVHVLARRRVR